MSAESIDLLLNYSGSEAEVPREAGAHQAVPDSRPQTTDPGAPSRKKSPVILVADDDPTVLFLASQTLTSKAFEVLQAQDGEIALELYESTQPDLILCDVMMPNIDGFELCSAIRRRESGAQIPIVMLTGLNDARSIRQAFSIGATDYCEKPVNWDLLPFKVDYVLRSSSAFRELQTSKERYDLLSQSINDGLWDWTFDDDRIYFSPRWKSMLGLAEDAVDSDPLTWIDRIHPDDKSGVINELHAHKDGESSRFECEYRIQHADGSYRWMLCRGLAVRDKRGVVCRMTGSQTDIEARKHLEEELARLEVD